MSDENNHMNEAQEPSEAYKKGNNDSFNKRKAMVQKAHLKGKNPDAIRMTLDEVREHLKAVVKK